MNDAIKQLITRGFGLPEPTQCTAITNGLINQTFDIDHLWILQHVNPIFGPAVNADIAALTDVLRSHGIPVPTLCRTRTGDFFVDGTAYGLTPGPWRLMRKLPGETCHKVEHIEQIRALTTAIARFHGALHGFHYTFQHTRPGVHDFERHRTALERAIHTESLKKHRLWFQVVSLFDEIQVLMRYIDVDSVLACKYLRIIHGDPKVSNFLFDQFEVTGIVDLDTMALSRTAFELGDAVRSWCNPRTEDVEPAYNREFAREVMGLYQEEAPFLQRDERQSLQASAPFITLELAMRFGRDALCEDYFGFNPEIGHGEHSLMRARAMTSLCAQMLEGRSV